MLNAAAVFLALTPQAESPKEIHGVWFSPAEAAVFASPATIAEAMDFVLDAGANVVFVPVWVEGKPNYPSGVLKDVLGLEPPRRDLLEELVFAAHRSGLEIVPWIDPAGVAKLNPAEDAGRDLLRKVVLEICQNYDVDGIHGTGGVADLGKEIAAVDAGIVVPTLPPLDAPDPDKGGDRLLTYPRLKEKEAELAETLRNGAWAEPALLPWRSGRIWRRRVEAVDPSAGEGTWSWAQIEGEPQCLILEGGQHGHATWTCTPKDSGVYSLFVWIPARDDQTGKASYRMTAAKGAKDIVIDPTKAANRGWIRLGNVSLEAGKAAEVARLLAEEDDATKVTVAGALLPVLNRRAMRR